MEEKVALIPERAYWREIFLHFERFVFEGLFLHPKHFFSLERLFCVLKDFF